MNNLLTSGGMNIAEGRIYPSWDIIKKFHNPLTEGEETLALFLDKNLPKEWKIFVQPYLNGSQPDIVILNPKIGVMVYEVKDYKLSTYNWKNKSRSPEDADQKKVKSHIYQVNHYKEKMIQLIPDMGENIDNNRHLYGLIRTGIYLHKIPGEDARILFGNIDYPTVVGYDDLEDKNISTIIPRAKYESGYMKKDWADELFFWLNPPFHSKEQSEPIELTKDQKIYAQPKPGHRRLRGVAGSGKTLVIAYKAAQLASEDKKVLVITFNLTLWHYVRDMIARCPYDFEWSNISFNHFHGFCNDILNELNIPKPHQNYLENIVKTVENAISDRDIDEYKFDAILIDEGQDYEWSWYNLLSLFLKDRNELFFVCDKKQNIYDRELSWIENMGEFEGKVQFKGVWPELKTVYRIPKKIGDIANKFSEEFELEESIEVSEEYQQLTLFDKPPIFEWNNIDSREWLMYVMEAYETIKYQQINLGEGHASDIVILLPTKNMGIKAVEAFKKQNIDVNHVFEHDEQAKFHRHKKAFWLGDSRLKISTIHSFKGWEALHVIMLIPRRWRQSENLDSIVYTAMTRSRKNLIILNSHDRYWEFGEHLNQTENLIEDEMEISSDLDENELEDWIETLPYPIASILWANITSLTYEHKVKYLLHFFEAFSKFNFNLLLSGLSADIFAYERDVAFCFADSESKYGEWWFNEPSFGNWNYYGGSLASIIRNQLKDKYQRNQCSKLFGKPKNELLAKLSDYDLFQILKKASKYRNVWDAHGPRVSEDEYKKRHGILTVLLAELQNILSDAFKDNLLIIPVQGTLEDGVYDFTVKKFVGTNERFRPMKIKTSNPLDKSRIYMITTNKRKPLELLPLIRLKDDVCYFYNGKNQNDGMAQYVSYYEQDKAEISLPEDPNLIGLLNYNYDNEKDINYSDNSTPYFKRR